MKLSGMAGTGSGKLGSNVYATNSGEQIVRIYQPNVSNPNTVGQVNQRAKFKLMSQIAAAMSRVIAIPKDGMKTPRNQFVSRNFDKCFANGENATVLLENLQLTKGNAGLPAVNASRTNGTSPISVELAENAFNSVSRVVYNAFSVSSEGNLQLVGSVVATEAGANGTFPATLPACDGQVVVYAYGMKDLNQAASAKYGNYQVSTGEDIARLVMSRKISNSDYQFTQTSGNVILSGENSTTDVPAGSVKIIAYTSQGNKVQRVGGGAPAQRIEFVVALGTTFQLSCIPGNSFAFEAWVDDDTNEVMSTANPVTITANANLTLFAVASYYIQGLE